MLRMSPLQRCISPEAQPQLSQTGYDPAMRIGIVGSDDRAIGIGRLLAGGGHEVTVADPRRPDRAEQAATALGTHSDQPYRQAMRSDLLFLAVAPEDLDKTVTAVGSGAEAVIVDAVQDEPVVGEHTGAEVLARKLDNDRIVRVVIGTAQPGANVQMCGDDQTAKTLVDQALQSCGCPTTDRGPLANAVELEPRL